MPVRPKYPLCPAALARACCVFPGSVQSGMLSRGLQRRCRADVSSSSVRTSSGFWASRDICPHGSTAAPAVGLRLHPGPRRAGRGKSSSCVVREVLITGRECAPCAEHTRAGPVCYSQLLRSPPAPADELSTLQKGLPSLLRDRAVGGA